jgi:3-oxoadipate enol-lactonase
VRLHHRFDGDPASPALLMSGSLGSTLAMWERQLPLAERFRLVRFDHPGHGSSPPVAEPVTIDELGRAAVGLLDELELERVSFCGSSLGAMIAMWVGVHAPERIDRLVLCCTSAHLGPRKRWEDRAALVRRSGTAAVAEQVVAGWFTSRFPDRERERFQAMLAATDPESYARCCEAIRDLDLRADLSRIVAPTVVIAGAEDPSTPVDHAETIVRGIVDSQLVVIPAAAHLAAFEQAEAVNDAVLEHLAVAA